MNKQRIVSNLLIMSMGQAVTWVLSLVYLVLMSRYLKPSRLGEFTLAFSIVSVLRIVIDFGLDTLITRSIARSPGRAAALVSAAMIVRSLVAIPAIVVLVIYVHAMHLDAETSIAAYIMVVGMVIRSLTGALIAAFQGREEMSLNAQWLVADNALSLGLGVVVVLMHGGVVALAINFTVIAVLLLGMNLRWMRRFGSLTAHMSRDDLREVATGGIPFLTKDVFFTIYLYIDSVILAALAGNRAVGIYTPATRMFNVALFVATIVGPVTLPLLSRLGVDAGTDFGRVGRQTLSLLMLCGVPVAIGLATFARPLIFTVFGPDYGPSAPVLVVLSLCILPMFLNIQFSQMLAACDQQWRWTAVLAASCVVNPLLNVALIPFAQQTWHNAAIGAATALVITEVLSACYGIAILRGVLLDRAFGRVVAGAVAAGAVQAAALWLATPVWPVIGEALGLMAYAAAALAIGALPREEIMYLYSMLSRRLRGGAERDDTPPVGGQADHAGITG